MSGPVHSRTPGSRPTGAQEVRAAVVRAASRRFAAEGTHASLRDIAADADVNIGLIHRHIGNKRDLVQAVLASQSQTGAQRVGQARDLEEAFESMFSRLDTRGDYVRILAWLLLGREDDISHPRDCATITALRDKAPASKDDLPLLAAMALLYGWTVFGDQLVDAFGITSTDREAVDARLGSLAAALVNRGR
jgi:AcrR family transcriptional regulator